MKEITEETSYPAKEVSSVNILGIFRIL